MKGAEWLRVELYMQTQILSGFIYQPYEGRLLDLLNGVWVRQPESRGRFIELSEVTIHYVDGKTERLPSAYINKATIQLAATSDGDLARGLGVKVGPKPYPFMQKLSAPVRLRMPAYALVGNMHCTSRQRAWHVLEEKLMFLPLTDVKIRALANGIWSNVPFVAVNREQILSLQEEETPLAPGSSPST
ncbi:unnamed protein product [marine sediment metagenome]|uniref:Uncharacterized protein n=1 Tax=marine sediment metagenome TaxID=412755 RepID=X1MM83_9ZZZZ